MFHHVDILGQSKGWMLKLSDQTFVFVFSVVVAMVNEIRFASMRLFDKQSKMWKTPVSKWS